VLAAARTLGEALGGPVERRRLVSFLRGNRLPPSPAPGARGRAVDLDAYALFAWARALWLEDLIDGLLEEGYLAPSPRALSRLAVSPEGEKALGPGERLPDGAFPRGPRLGEGGEVEARLQALRREIAAREGRAPFSIFPNATLVELAAARPRSLAELASVPGLGEARIRRYGQRIVRAVKG
jgi:ATP-dependent DNA helicase RecQ